MFDIEAKKLIKSCKPILEELFRKHKKTYIDLFFYEKDTHFSKFSLDLLVSVGILRRIKKETYRAKVQVYPLEGKFIVTDFIVPFSRKRKYDDVWGILPDESVYIAKKVAVRKGEVVLDLSTGSGIIAIFCADKAKKVYATDINPKAINYAKFNAILNNAEDKIEFRTGDLFEPVKGLKFDLTVIPRCLHRLGRKPKAVSYGNRARASLHLQNKISLGFRG